MAKMDTLEKIDEVGGEALQAVEDFGEDVYERLKRLTRLHLPTRESKKPLKRSKTGYETEMFVLDSKGRVDQTGNFLKIAKKKGMPVTNEAVKGMVEVLCLPHHHHRSTSIWLANNLINIAETAEKHNYVIYPFGTYPGKQDPKIYNKKWYKIQQKLFGKDRYKNSGLCCGYHQHYSLPRGLFDEKTQHLKYTTSSKVKRTLLDSYNFLTAADPALTVMLQCSPFVQGKHLAKDSRMLLYRGSTALNYPHAKYSYRLSLFGELSPYEWTLRDLRHRIEQRRLKFQELLIANGIPHGKITTPRKSLSFTWNPVKINPHGTLEYRGPDMTMMSHVFGASTLLKFALRKIQQDFTLVIPMDIDLKDAFKLEDNLLFIPSHTTVREELQPASAYEGLKNKGLRTYTSRFFKFVKGEISRFDPDYLPLLKPIQRTLDSGKTLSDKMMKQAKRDGYSEELPQEYAQEFALKYATKWTKDLHEAKAVLQKSKVYD